MEDLRYTGPNMLSIDSLRLVRPRQTAAMGYNRAAGWQVFEMFCIMGPADDGRS